MKTSTLAVLAGLVLLGLGGVAHEAHGELIFSDDFSSGDLAQWEVLGDTTYYLYNADEALVMVPNWSGRGVVMPALSAPLGSGSYEMAFDLQNNLLYGGLDAFAACLSHLDDSDMPTLEEILELTSTPTDEYVIVTAGNTIFGTRGGWDVDVTPDPGVNGLAHYSITFDISDGYVVPFLIIGEASARSGRVTVDDFNLSRLPTATAVPEPATIVLLGAGLAAFAARTLYRKSE